MRVLLNNFLLLSTVITSTWTTNQFARNKLNHRHQELTNSEVRYLAGLSNTRHIDDVLDNILIPRVVGTPNHEKVFDYIKKQLNNLRWNVEVDEFEDDTPLFGTLTFKNIIGTLNPNAERFLVLACHYDSKYFANEEFVGAIDSAVPCAMLLNMAKVMKTDLSYLDENSELGLKFIFFDGEEAFKEWGPLDSIYGARHLADKLESTRTASKGTGEMVNDLDRIDLFVLLDLLGARNPTFLSFQRKSEYWFVRLSEIERNLASLGLLKDHNQNYFIRRRSFSRIEDDHVPFLEKNVPVLHVITAPFPSEWHTIHDDRSIVDMTTVENLNKILRVFVAEYLHLSVNKK